MKIYSSSSSSTFISFSAIAHEIAFSTDKLATCCVLYFSLSAHYQRAIISVAHYKMKMLIFMIRRKRKDSGDDFSA
jgi:hypothetical protein